jgi:hypothetical protein
MRRIGSLQRHKVVADGRCCRANEHASRSGKKTIVPQDVFMALEDIEFPDFRPRLEAELASQSASAL